MPLEQSWIAVNCGNPDAVLARLGLKPSGQFEVAPKADFTARGLPSGWYLIIARVEHPLFNQREFLAALSNAYPVLHWISESPALASSARLYHAGHCVWSVVHVKTKVIEHIEVDGAPPPECQELHDHWVAQQQSDSGPAFDIPRKLAELFIGYQPGATPEGDEEGAYAVLAPAHAPASHSSWLRKFIGSP
jgi:hypothetical protein